MDFKLPQVNIGTLVDFLTYLFRKSGVPEKDPIEDAADRGDVLALAGAIITRARTAGVCPVCGKKADILPDEKQSLFEVWFNHRSSCHDVNVYVVADSSERAEELAEAWVQKEFPTDFLDYTKGVCVRRSGRIVLQEN